MMVKGLSFLLFVFTATNALAENSACKIFPKSDPNYCSDQCNAMAGVIPPLLSGNQSWSAQGCIANCPYASSRPNDPVVISQYLQPLAYYTSTACNPQDLYLLAFATYPTAGLFINKNTYYYGYQEMGITLYCGFPNALSLYNRTAGEAYNVPNLTIQSTWVNLGICK